MKNAIILDYVPVWYMYATDLFNDVAIWSYKRYLQCFVVVVGSRIEFVELCSLQSCLLAWLQMKLLVQISRGKELLILSNNLHVCGQCRAE